MKKSNLDFCSLLFFNSLFLRVDMLSPELGGRLLQSDSTNNNKNRFCLKERKKELNTQNIME